MKINTDTGRLKRCSHPPVHPFFPFHIKKDFRKKIKENKFSSHPPYRSGSTPSKHSGYATGNSSNNFLIEQLYNVVLTWLSYYSMLHVTCRPTIVFHSRDSRTNVNVAEIRYRIVTFERLRPFTLCRIIRITNDTNTLKYGDTTNYCFTCTSVTSINCTEVKYHTPWQNGTSVSVLSSLFVYVTMDCDLYSSQNMNVWWYMLTDTSTVIVT